MQPERSDRVNGRKPVPAIAAALLALAGTVAYAREAPPPDRSRAIELIDALLALATVHGFEQTGTIRELLAFGIDTEGARTLTEAAFDDVPLSAMLDVIRHTRLYAELHEPGRSNMPSN